MRFDGMIFDIEGTLIDCIPQNLRSWQETLSAFGLTAPLNVLQLYSGMDGDDMLRIIASDKDKDFRKQALKAEGKNFEARYLSSVRAFKNIRPLFEAIKREGGKIAIATDCMDPALTLSCGAWCRRSDRCHRMRGGRQGRQTEPQAGPPRG
jgi:beta-phosphoglucomutase-like phosphatase (HAD superfamily)